MNGPDDGPADPTRIANRIGEATRDAQSALDGLDATPLSEKNLPYYMQATAVLDVVLRELLAAISAATTSPLEITAATTLIEEERAFATRAGILAEAFSDHAAQEREDWLAWSAIRLAQELGELERLSKLTVFDMIPGLSEVVTAFPSRFSDVERLHSLRSPMEELGGLSPLRWLLIGGDVHLLMGLVDDLGYDG